MSVVGGSYSGQANNNFTTLGTTKNSPLINHKPSFKGHHLRAVPAYYKKPHNNYNNSDELDSYESSYYQHPLMMMNQ